MKPTSLLLTCLIGLAVPTVGLAQPTITTQPQNQTNVVGTDATFIVVATGTEPLAYQWQFSFSELALKTNDTLIVTNVQPANAGSYAVVVTNITGAVTSVVATLTVIVPPAITKQPTNQSTSLGCNATFSAVASGTAPRFFQWRFNETNLIGKTGVSLVLTNAQLTNAGSYTVVVTNEAGSVTSRVATLTVDTNFTKITIGDPVNDALEFWGCQWIDYDNDGFPDLFVTTRAATHNYLFRNNGHGSLTKVAAGAIVTDTGTSRDSTWGDFDNDGFLDVVVGRQGGDGVLFYRNHGDGTFLKVANPFPGTAGVRVFGPDCADYDRDGFLDLFVPNQDGNNFLYRNNGDGTFARVVGQRIATDRGGHWAAWADYDNDGWPDLFAPNDFSDRAYLYRNAANGSFDRILTGPLSTSINYNHGAWGDYNNDGLLDFFVSFGGHLGADRNSLYRNNGDATFTKITTGALVTEAKQYHGCAWGDYDNDGFLDLFVLNIAEGGNNFLYHNNGDGTFEKIVEGSLVNESGFSNGCAWGDYDNDGFLDLFVTNGGIDGQRKNFFYRNNGNGNAWMKVRCVGTVSNRSAIGAKVRVRATFGGKTFWQLREISSGSGLIAHFGLGNATNIEALRIEWPSGIVQEFHDVAPKQFLTLTEPARLQALGTGVLRIQSWKGMAFEVQTSTDLGQWAPLTTVTNLSGALEFTDPDVANQGARFYRTLLR